MLEMIALVSVVALTLVLECLHQAVIKTENEREARVKKFEENRERQKKNRELREILS